MSLKVTVVDEQTGETQTGAVPDGDYMILVTTPAYLAATRTFRGGHTHILTIRDRLEQTAIGQTVRYSPPGQPEPER